MKGREILQRVRLVQTERYPFIRWWRKENDFVDYQLVESFIESVGQDQDFADFQLLDMEEMWQALKRVKPQGLSREKRRSGEVVVWNRVGDAGEKVCPYTAESLMEIFDAETRGNVVDS